MPRKTKASAEEKVQIVEAYLRGEMGLKSAAAKLSVVISTMELWIALYRAEGSNAFVQAKKNRCYPPEVKEAATKEYLFGKDSILSICQKYCIRSTRSLQQWIKVYHAHGDFNSRKNSGGGSYMKQGRDTTQEERIQIVKDCLASGKDYGEMALKLQGKLPAGTHMDAAVRGDGRGRSGGPARKEEEGSNSQNRAGESADQD